MKEDFSVIDFMILRKKEDLERLMQTLEYHLDKAIERKEELLLKVLTKSKE